MKIKQLFIAAFFCFLPLFGISYSHACTDLSMLEYRGDRSYDPKAAKFTRVRNMTFVMDGVVTKRNVRFWIWKVKHRNNYGTSYSALKISTGASIPMNIRWYAAQTGVTTTSASVLTDCTADRYIADYWAARTAGFPYKPPFIGRSANTNFHWIGSGPEGFYGTGRLVFP